MANNPEKRTSPIPIANSRRRARSASMSSSDSSPASPPSELPTPSSGAYSPRVTIPSPGSSPILSYFLAQSPTKTPGAATFPFRKFSTAPVFEEEEPVETHAARHARRASTTVADRFAQSGGTGVPDNQLERGTGLLRRLSLSTGPPTFSRPPVQGSGSPPAAPPNSAVSPTAKGIPFSQQTTTKPRRSATVTADAKPRRAPSPMGERILKGHFDGFN
ncbi:hypothetical protein Moror_3918 [Moniliophthora roreri MCA 2997]|uniref:Uncharacterized protein n=2 Tax=Moniliophthora roreri TaxID=221103 RepID=V2YUH1_MONRO|nr:hypothetical protein Moror_3918 [Moniliophthora roreri MCA 2997]KAI3600989.1 hypothetical protein WG66_014845 [Moniliophthora roreri]